LIATLLMRTIGSTLVLVRVHVLMALALAFTLSIIGPDRPGIMSEVTTALVSNQVNLAEVATRVGPAPMTGDQTFFAEVNILVPEGVPMVSLENALQRIADDLAVDIRFE